MSVQNAFSFITRVRGRDALWEELCALGPVDSLDEYVLVGARHGMVFSVDELETAFRYEWTMRSIGAGLHRRQ